jgi:hypothetical protein
MDKRLPEETPEEVYQRWLTAFREKGLSESELAKLEEELLTSGLAERVIAAKAGFFQRQEALRKVRIPDSESGGATGSILRNDKKKSD